MSNKQRFVIVNGAQQSEESPKRFAIPFMSFILKNEALRVKIFRDNLSPFNSKS